MQEPKDQGQEAAASEAAWRGVDLSGVTLVLGAGTGRLLELLTEGAAAAGGTVVLVEFSRRLLAPLATLSEKGPLVRLNGRPRQIPLRSETVDLLAASSVLRETPENHLRTLAEEFWRVLVPGGRLRVSDILDPTETEENRAWAQRAAIVRKLAEALDRPTALAVNIQAAAAAFRVTGFENLSVALLPGYALTDAWLEETVNAARSMAARLVDRTLRNEVLHKDIDHLIGAYALGGQRAAPRFVLQGNKPGDLALSMESGFTEEDLHPDLDD
ncbi:MAG: class I SAM-dependent methyltransferase [Anaerolineae bacterium]